MKEQSMIRSCFKWILRILFFPIWIWAMHRRHRRELAMARQGPVCLCYPEGEAYKDCPVHVEEYRIKIPTLETRINDDNLMQIKVHDEWLTVEKPEPKTHPNNELRSLVLMTARSQAVKDGKCPVNTFVLLGPHKAIEVIGESVKVRYQEFYPKATDLDTGRTSYDCESGLFKSIQRDHWNKNGFCQVGPEFIFEMPNAELVKVFCGSRSRLHASEKIKRVPAAEHLLTAQQISTKKYTWWTIQFEHLDYRVAAPEAQYTLELLDGRGMVYTKIPIVTETQEGILCTAEFTIGRTMMKTDSRVRRNGISLGERCVSGQVGPGTIVKVRHLLKSKPIWMGDPISELANKRLWNIVQAMDRGTWASGSICKIKYDLAQDLYGEYNKRRAAGEYTKKKIKKIKRENKKYEAKFCTHGKDVSKTYPSCAVCHGVVLDRGHLTDIRIDD